MSEHFIGMQMIRRIWYSAGHYTSENKGMFASLHLLIPPRLRPFSLVARVARATALSPRNKALLSRDIDYTFADSTLAIRFSCL